MEDNRMFEDISCEEYYEAMEGFEEWRREIEAELWKDIQSGEWGF